MADNTQIPGGGTGDVIRDKDRAGVKTQVVGMDVNVGGVEMLSTGTAVGAKNAQDVNLAASGGGVAAITGTLSGSGVSVGGACNLSGNATVIAWGGTYTNLPIAFEASYDNTNWFPIDATPANGYNPVTAALLTANLAANAAVAWNLTLPGYQYVRVRQTAAAATQVLGPSIAIVQGPFAFDPSPSVSPLDGVKATYSCALNATNVASPVTASDVWCLQNPVGSGKLIRVTRLLWQVTLATAGSAGQVQLLKRTTLNTGGTSVAQTATSHDSQDVAASGASLLYSALAPTALGTAAGPYAARRIFGVATVLVAQPTAMEWEARRPSKAIVLRPGQQLSLYNVAAFATAPTVTGDAEWTEEAA